jgi:hypothetical protein
MCRTSPITNHFNLPEQDLSIPLPSFLKAPKFCSKQDFFSFMEKNNNKKIIWLGLTISLFFVFIFFITKDIGQNIVPTSLSENYQTVKTPPALPLNKGEEKIGDRVILEIEEIKYEAKIGKEESVYDFMLELQKESKINFKDQNYPGMGKLIEEINGVKNNGEKNWIYYVNNKKAKIGVSNYKVKSGDVVSWKYEEDIN